MVLETLKQYAERDARAQGQWFITHMSAMTVEKLHSKSEIASELAHRDIQIEALQQEIHDLHYYGVEADDT